MSNHRTLPPSFIQPVRYILKDGKPIPARSSEEFDAFIADVENRRVDANQLEDHAGTEIFISTVFLGIDHNFSGKGLPLLWETQITWPGNEAFHFWQKRYTSEEAARVGHQAAVFLVKADLLEEKKQ
jgi:hypothetical protein